MTTLPTGPSSAGGAQASGPLGGAEGTRTPDPLHAMQMRYQLRHSPKVLSEVEALRTTRGRLAKGVRGSESWVAPGGSAGDDPVVGGHPPCSVGLGSLEDDPAAVVEA